MLEEPEGLPEIFPRAQPCSLVVIGSMIHYILLGTLRSNDADGKENVKKTIGFISKTTTLHVHHAFLHISFPFLHDYDVKMPNLASYRVCKQATAKFYFSFRTWIWSLGIPFHEDSPTFDIVSG